MHPLSPARPRSWFTRTLAAAALAVLGAHAALAADAVKLQVEIYEDVAQLEAGQQVTVQVVGIDAAGNRVVIKDVESSSTHGEFKVVQAPYKYTFTAPTNLPDTTRVRLRAWLRATPEISGETSIDVLPPVPYERMFLSGPGTTPAGTTIDLDLTGQTRAGATEAVKDTLVKVWVESGPGTVTLVRPGRYRFEAAAGASGTARIAAQLIRHPKVRSSMDILVTTGSGGPAPTPTPNPNPRPKPKPDPAPDKPPVPTKPEGEDNDVIWPGGNIRIGTWRTRSAAETVWSPEEKALPKPGGEFVASKEFQKLRIVVLRADVVGVVIEQWVGEKKSADVKRLEPTKDGPFQLERNKKGNQVIHFETSTPDTGKPLFVSILLTYTDGKTSREELTLRRDVPGKK